MLPPAPAAAVEVAAIGVDDNVLRRGKKRDEQGSGRDRKELGGRWLGVAQREERTGERRGADAEHERDDAPSTATQRPEGPGAAIHRSPADIPTHSRQDKRRAWVPWMMRAAFTCQSGGLFGFSRQGSQAV